MTPIDGGERPTDFLDQVYFGNADSEADRLESTDAPVIDGGLGVPGRSIEPRGRIAVDLTCDPDKQTFFTARLWAGEPSRTHVQFAIDGEKVQTKARVTEPELGERFYYVTVAIPPRYTADQSTVTIELTPANEGADDVYALYTHTENFYAPPAEETQGSPPAPPEPTEPDFDAMRENVLAAFDQGIRNQMEMQRYDDPDSKWHGLAGGDAFKLNATSLAENYLRAYRTAGSAFQGDEAMIERSLAAFDGYTRALGHRGVMGQFGWRSGGWLGCPDRSGRGHGLMGYAATNIGRSFVALIPVLKDRPELLEQEIDHDCDPETSITRREAYTQFWRKVLWENFLPRFGLGEKVSNQDIENNQAIMWANEALKFLSREDAVPEDIVMAVQRKVAGILPVEDDLIDFMLELQTRNPGEYGQRRQGEGRFYENRHYHWSATRHFYSYTPKGVGFEFGYAVGYGYRHNKFAAMANQADDHRIDDRFRTYLHGSAHTLIPGLKHTGDRWVRVGAIGSRGTGRDFLGPAGGYGWVYGALEYDSDPAKRVVREYLRYANDFESIGAGDNPRDVRGRGEWLEVLPDLREWWSNADPPEYRLPAERDSPYAWCDEMMGLAMIHDSDGTYYLERMGQSIRADYDGEKRYHRITDEYRAFGDARAELCHASRIETATVGPYEVTMNRTSTHDVRVQGGPRIHHSTIDTDGVIDLISGAVVDPSREQVLGPAESLVLDRRRTATPSTSGAPTPELTATTVDEQTRRKHWEWSVPEACSEAAVYSLPLDDSPETAQVARYYENAATMGTRQFARLAMNKYRPSQVPEKNLLSVETSDGRGLPVENVDGCTHRLLAERSATAPSALTGQAILPTFETYEDWSVDRSGMPAASVRTDEVLEVRLEESTTVTADTPLTFSLDLDRPVERVVFTIESNWDLSGLRTVLETASGDVLWQEDVPEEIPSWDWSDSPNQTDEVVNIEGIHATDGLHFRVDNQVASEDMDDLYYRDMTAGATMWEAGETQTVEAGWYRRISDVRIEYTDGSAVYPHRQP